MTRLDQIVLALISQIESVVLCKTLAINQPEVEEVFALSLVSLAVKIEKAIADEELKQVNV